MLQNSEIRSYQVSPDKSIGGFVVPKAIIVEDPKLSAKSSDFIRIELVFDEYTVWAKCYYREMFSRGVTRESLFAYCTRLISWTVDQRTVSVYNCGTDGVIIRDLKGKTAWIPTGDWAVNDNKGINTPAYKGEKKASDNN